MKAKNYFSQRGSTALLVVLFLATASAVIISSLQSLVVNQSSQKGGRSSKQEYFEILKSLKETVESDSFCNQTQTGVVGAVRLQGQNLANVVAPTQLRIPRRGSVVNFGPGWRSSKGDIRVTGVRFKHLGNWNGYTHSFATTAKTSIRASYKLLVDAVICKDSLCDESNSQSITNERTTSGYLNPYTVEIFMNIRFEATKAALSQAVIDAKMSTLDPITDFLTPVSGARAVTCFGPGSGGFYCEELGRIWNPFKGTPELRCEPHDSCYRINVSPGNTCSAPYVRKHVGRARIGSGPYVQKFLCEWCNPNSSLSSLGF